jgi:hypothetical protein
MFLAGNNTIKNNKKYSKQEIFILKIISFVQLSVYNCYNNEKAALVRAQQ